MKEFRGTKIQPDVVITGEAIALLVQPASLFLRAISAVIDASVAILGFLLTLVIFVFSSVLITDDASGYATAFISNQAQFSAFMAALAAVWLFFIPMLVETLTNGKSLGRYIVGTRIVRDDGGPIRLRHAFVRTLIGLFELWTTLGAGAIIAALTNRRGKRIGDIFAGTYAISEPSGITRQPLLIAPELSTWAASANVGDLDGVTTVMARRFLQSATKMDPARRNQVALSIASDLSAHVYPDPPPGTDPERFIAAVLVLRRDAEYHTSAHSSARLERKLAAVSASRFEIQ